MSARSDPEDQAALQSLLAATWLSWPLGEDQERLDQLVAVVADAVHARVGVLQAVDDRSGRWVVAASCGGPCGVAELAEADLTEGVAGRVLAEGSEIEVPRAAAAALLPGPLAAAGMRHALALPVRTRERVLGVVTVASPEPLEDHPLRRHAARVAADRIGWTLEQARLYETLERAMAQILESDERMLGRIGLDIHDGPTQQLSVALLEVQLLEADLTDAETAGAELPHKLRPALGRIYETLGGALHEMRELIGHLRPAQFENRRLPEILQDAVVAFEARSGSRVTTEVDGEFREDGVSLSQKITFYRILQEALTNAYRHGRSTQVGVEVREGPEGISLRVSDNGDGFDPEGIQRPRPGVPQARFGLHGMRDRANLLGGTFEIASTPGSGATVRVFLPRWRPQDRAGTGAGSR